MMKDTIRPTRRMVMMMMMTGSAAFMLTSGLRPAAAQGRELVFGLSLPITGDLAEYGKFLLNGVTLAVDEANAAGGIDGVPIRLVVEDSRGDPKEAVLIAERFTSDPAILLGLGDFTSSASMAAAPIYERANMAQFAPTATHPDFSSMGANMIRVMAPQEAESKFLAEWVAGDSGLRRVATVFVNNDWGLQANRAFGKRARELGMEVLTEEGITLGERDFAAVVTKIKALKPDAVFIAAQYAEMGAILAQARRARLKTQFINSGAPQSPELLELAGSAAEGILAAALYVPENPEPVSAAFTKAYQKVHGTVPNLFAALGYDAAKLAIHGATEAKGDRSAVAPAIFRLSSFKGVTGRFDYSASRDPAKVYTRTVVRDGAWVLFN